MNDDRSHHTVTCLDNDVKVTGDKVASKFHFCRTANGYFAFILRMLLLLKRSFEGVCDKSNFSIKSGIRIYGISAIRNRYKTKIDRQLGSEIPNGSFALHSASVEVRVYVLRGRNRRHRLFNLDDSITPMTVRCLDRFASVMILQAGSQNASTFCKTLIECRLFNDCTLPDCVRTNLTFVTCVGHEDIRKRSTKPEFRKNYVTQEVELTVSQVTETIAGSKRNMNQNENLQNNYHECVTKTRRKKGIERSSFLNWFLQLPLNQNQYRE
ncbi:hypothetical protein ACTXT7_015064 [Hymenolepis weldensis]